MLGVCECLHIKALLLVMLVQPERAAIERDEGGTPNSDALEAGLAISVVRLYTS